MLFAPCDFRNDEAYLETLPSRRAELANINRRIETVISDTLSNRALLQRLEEVPHTEVGDILSDAARSMSQEIREENFVTVDCSGICGTDNVAVLPYAAFEDFRDFRDEVWYRLDGAVPSWTYGYDWVMRDKITGAVLRSLKMIKRVPRGTQYPDTRSLKEAGIEPGSVLEVVDLRSPEGRKVIEGDTSNKSGAQGQAQA